MVRNRPTIVLVIATGNMCLAGLGLGGLACFGCFVTAVGAFIGFFSLKKGDLLPPAFTLNYVIFNAVLVLLTSFLLLVSGLGLLKMRPWARWVSALSGGILILAPLAEVLLIITYYNPEMQRSKQDEREQTSRFYQERGIVVNPQPHPSAQEPEFNPMVSAFGWLPGMAYGVMVLVVMFLPRVSSSFAERGRALPRQTRG